MTRKAALPPSEESPVTTSRKPPQHKPTSNRPKVDDLSALRRRAKLAGTEAREGVNLTVKIPKALYKAIIETAEEFHQPVTEVARQALGDGIRKYRDWGNRPNYIPAPRIPMLRAQEPLPRVGANSDSRLARLAAEAKARAFASAPPEEEEDNGVVLPKDVEAALSRIPTGALFPSTAPPVQESVDVVLGEEPLENE